MYAYLRPNAGMPLRLIVADHVSKPSLAGKVGVAGKVDCGALAVGMQVYVQPAGAFATVKAVEVQGAASSLAVAGAAVEVGLAGLQAEDVPIGSCLCHAAYPVHCARRIQARMRSGHTWVFGVLAAILSRDAENVCACLRQLTFLHEQLESHPQLGHTF